MALILTRHDVICTSLTGGVFLSEWLPLLAPGTRAAVSSRSLRRCIQPPPHLSPVDTSQYPLQTVLSQTTLAQTALSHNHLHECAKPLAIIVVPPYDNQCGSLWIFFVALVFGSKTATVRAGHWLCQTMSHPDATSEVRLVNQQQSSALAPQSAQKILETI